MITRSTLAPDVLATCPDRPAEDSPEAVTPAVELSIERRPGPLSTCVSREDAVWPGRARVLLWDHLTQWGLAHLVDAGEVLITELVTNALRHTASPAIAIRFFRRDGVLVIEVDDGSPGHPRLRAAGPDDEGGRGLFLVEALSSSWGVSEDGTTTWCTLPLAEGAPR